MAWPGWLLDAWTRVKPYADKAALWRGYEAELTWLTILTLGIAVYTVLVFAFYQGLSRRIPLHSGWGKGSWWGSTIRGLESTFVFPIVSFLYFAVLAGSLFFLSKSLTTYQIFLVSMAVVAGVRLTAFVTENAAVDLAKLLPLSLLAIVIVDPSYQTWPAIWAKYREIPGLLPVLARFFFLFLILETGLRLGKIGIERVRTTWPRRHRAPATDATVSLEVLDTKVEESRPKAP